MKKIFLVALLVAGAGLATSEAQTTRTSFSAQTGVRSENIQRQAPQPTRRGEIGAIPRAIRAGSIIHVINPRAPRRYYGAPQDTVTWEPLFLRERYTGHQITGIILAGITW